MNVPEFYVSEIIYYNPLCLASFTQKNYFEIHLCFNMYQ